MAGFFARQRRTLERLINFLSPPAAWQIPVIVALGSFVAFIIFVFHVSRASSYLSDNPTTCVNCHVMAPQFVTWQHSSHAAVATCNDCHVPHDNFLRHYYFKASDGLRHATIFTMRTEPQVIRIHDAGMVVVQENCIRCHEMQVGDISVKMVRGDDRAHAAGLRCWDCHRTVPHGEVNSLASVPFAHVPVPSPVTPDWMRHLLQRDLQNDEP